MKLGNIDACPVTKATWDLRAEAKKADCGNTNEYHCLTDSEGRKWEKCLEKTLIDKGHCPIFTSDGFLDWRGCNTSDPACPNSSFVSNEVYKYPWCFGNNTATNRTLNSVDHGVDGLLLGLIIGIVGLGILLIVVAAIYFIRKKKSKRVYKDHKGNAEEFLLPDKVDKVAGRTQVKNGYETLLRKDVKALVVIGDIGSSVYTTSSFILKKIAKHTQWKQEIHLYSEVPKSVNEHTIMLVYGWFGLLNDDLCSEDKAKQACENLKHLLHDKNFTVKVIIGMRKTAHIKYQADLERWCDDFVNVLHLGDSSEIDEMSSYFHKVNRLCSNKKCPCKRLKTKMLREGKDSCVGMPLKINIFKNHHDPDMIESYLNDKPYDILRVMIKYITGLANNEKDAHIYNWIKYICLKGDFSPSDQFDKDMTREMRMNISRSGFDPNDVDLGKFLKKMSLKQQNNDEESDATYSFWHPFIYICVFHSLYEEDKTIIMEHCNFDAIFQLVRPKGCATSYIEVSADDDCVKLLKERLGQDENGVAKKYENHPLLKESTAAQ